jgi:hypothetical protein
MRVTVPKSLTLHDSAYMLDGGTTCLMCTDEAGRQRTITLAQSMFPEPNPLSEYIPGRLYLDDDLVAVRSAEEQDILAALRSAKIVRNSADSSQAGERIKLSPNALILGDDIKRVLSSTPDENLRAMLAQVISKVASPDFVTFAAKTAGAKSSE